MSVNGLAISGKMCLTVCKFILSKPAELFGLKLFTILHVSVDVNGEKKNEFIKNPERYLLKFDLFVSHLLLYWAPSLQKMNLNYLTVMMEN